MSECPQDPRVRIAAWPCGRPFALFLSHDVDQIHDREFWKILADFNHVRKTFLNGEQGRLPLALPRIRRSFLRPNPAILGFEAVLEIEAHHGFRSTFFLLHDRYWARNGARYRLTDAELLGIVERVLDAGCEIGVHGGYYSFNDASAYRASAEIIGETFGVEPVGIRNHLLRFSGSVTWQAQAEAGFSYDATYGHRDQLGPPKMHHEPFWAKDDESRRLDLIELPLTVMDTTVFRYLGLAGEAATRAVADATDHVASRGGLVTLLWHNNYFNEPEFEDWQQTYVAILDHLARKGPWCATGAEIAKWWRARSKVTVSVDERDPTRIEARVNMGEQIDGVTLEIDPRFSGSSAWIDGEEVQMDAEAGRPRLVLPQLEVDRETVVELILP